MNRGYTKPTGLIPLTNSHDFAQSRNESIRKLQSSGNGAYNNMLFSEDELWKFQNNRDYTPAEVEAMNLSPDQKTALLNSPALYYTSHDWYKGVIQWHWYTKSIQPECIRGQRKIPLRQFSRIF